MAAADEPLSHGKPRGIPAPPQYAPLRRRFRRTSSALLKLGDKNILKKSLLCNTNYIRLYIYLQRKIAIETYNHRKMKQYLLRMPLLLLFAALAVDA